MKTVGGIAKEKVSWNDVKEKYLKFHRMDKFTEDMAIDIDFGYWLANEVINEVLRKHAVIGSFSMQDLMLYYQDTENFDFTSKAIDVLNSMVNDRNATFTNV